MGPKQHLPRARARGSTKCGKCKLLQRRQFLWTVLQLQMPKRQTSFGRRYL